MGIFTILVNLLLLTGPLYMLHIYDRVLPSGAVQTLVALSLMACTEDLEVQTQQYLNRAMLIRALGMQSTTLTRQHRLQHAAQIAQLRASDISGLFTTIIRTLRMAMQSAMLGLGAWLVLQEQLSAGGMIATSILFGRLLNPLEVLIGSWIVPQRALLGWARLRGQLSQMLARHRPLALPRPAAQLTMQKATIVPPGGQIATLKLASFSVQAGSACGIIGAAGSGKSTLALAAMGVLPLANGTVQLGGTALAAYDTDNLGQYIGYLPQEMQLLPGTVAENITRYQAEASQERLFAAARNAGAFEMITQLPQGFDTDVRQLSGGQAQRIGLARALFGDPVLLVLDEPNSNLDNEGVAALNAAVRRFKRKGNTVLIIAHRPAAIQECDTIMVMESGQITAFGPKEDILRKMVKNHADISIPPAGGSAPHGV